MEQDEAQAGRKVQMETENNGPISHGVIESVEPNGLCWVRWDDGILFPAHRDALDLDE